MALPADFNKIYGSTATGGLTPISDVNYAKGWEFVGSNPPTKNDFSYLQNLSDLKAQWLYNNKLQRANPFGDIKSDGAAAVASALSNLGLGDGTGRLTGIKPFESSATYTKTPGTKFILVFGVGAGGAGGGAVVTNSTQVSGGVGGSAGTYAFARLTSGFDSVAVTIGAGGTGVSGANGNNGGETRFGSLLVFPGGLGGAFGPASTPTPTYGQVGPSAPATGTGIINQVRGQGGEGSFVPAISSVRGGRGGMSFLGCGTNTSPAAQKGNNAVNRGDGGGGAVNANSAGAAFAGGDGANGYLEVWEFA